MERIEARETDSGRKFPPWWQTIIIVLLTWLVSTAVNWGVLQAHQQDQKDRMDRQDIVISQMVPRVEYDH